VIDSEPVVGGLSSPTPTLLPHVIVLFGATGDLAARKLLPGLLHLSQSGMLPDFRIIGTSLSELSDEEFRHVARHACDQFATGKISLLEWAGFEQKLSFVSQATGPAGLAAAVTVAENALGGEARRLHYLSIPPGAARDVVQMLGEAGLVDRASVIMEKPFGTDLASAKQ
jgi:glucose-6-phosphate 1-dehydrogenase